MATLRPITAADFAAVAAMADDAAARALIGRPLWETEAEVAAAVGAPAAAAFFVAEDESGAITGLVGYRIRENGEAELYGPLVTTEGHGVGAYLESRAVTMAEQHGATAFSLLIGLHNRSGAAWAQWRGYERDTEEPELLLTWLYPGELKPVQVAAEAMVRPAVPGDLPAIEELFADCFPRAHSGAADWLSECWVVADAGRVEGFLRLEMGAAAWIHHLCVAPGARRRGLGAALLTGVVQQAQPGKVGLAVPLDDTAPVSLFRRLGFRREVPVAKWMKR